MKKSSQKTYRRLIQNVIQEINQLRPDSEAKLRERLDKKFKKYLHLADPTLLKNGPTRNPID